MCRYCLYEYKMTDLPYNIEFEKLHLIQLHPQIHLHIDKPYQKADGLFLL